MIVVGGMGYDKAGRDQKRATSEYHAPPMSDVTYRRLERHELARVGEIDRTERIDTLYVQRGVELEAVAGDFSASPWHAEGDGEHSVAQQVEACERWVDDGRDGDRRVRRRRGSSGSASSCRTSVPASRSSRSCT